MRWIVRLIGLVIVLVVVAVGSVFLLPEDRIAQVAVDQIRAQTGREVTLSGGTEISFYPVLGVATGPMEIGNAPWSDAGPMMRAEALKVGVDPIAMIRGDIRITGLELRSPRILLERAADGRVNWELGVEGVAPSGQEGARSAKLALYLDRALITDGVLRYADRGSGEETVMQGLSLDLRWADYEGAAEFEAGLRPAGETVAVSGRIDRFAQFINGDASALNLRVAAAGGEIGLNGQASLAPMIAGRIEGELPDTAAFMAALGQPGVSLPQGLGRRAALSGDLSLTPDDMRLSLREGSLTLDGNRLSGALDVFTAQTPPRVVGQISTGALDLSGLGGGGEAAAAGSGERAATAGWSTAPIDASALSLVNGELDLRADSVLVGGLSLNQTHIGATLDRARAVVTLREVAAYDGTLGGEVVANNRSGLSVGGDLRAQGVGLQGLLSDMAGLSRFTGAADAQVSFLGAGGSVDAIMRSLSGQGTLSTGRGTIQGIDLDKLFRAGDVSGGTTVFDSLSASFTIEDGVLRNDDLLMSLPVITARGEGRIGLGARDLDYLFTPRSGGTDGEGGVAIPVRIKGPWANPSIRPDMKVLLDENLEEEKKAAEEKARKKLNEAVEKKLGVTPEEGESVEDALKKKAEEKVKDALKGLLSK
ncbi:MAG: AsmA family protein [Sediminimonas sp.]|uniref:AsmA family protein n=1 Tax=Sediminimonas sp. TaxID=2823379 RepID=UPI00286FC379|nr:AsmA family protein [Sediminimonas sp.]MDR9483859.1 AsmA family protein [Sediminimonas sp.]